MSNYNAKDLEDASINAQISTDMVKAAADYAINFHQLSDLVRSEDSGLADSCEEICSVGERISDKVMQFRNKIDTSFSEFIAATVENEQTTQNETSESSSELDNIAGALDDIKF